jgi:hypothetical protein
MGNKRQKRQSSRKLHLKNIRFLGGRPQKNGSIEDESLVSNDQTDYTSLQILTLKKYSSRKVLFLLIFIC